MKTPTPQAQSDTPRTDAEAFSLGIGDCTVVDSDFARTLGRELAEANAAFDRAMQKVANQAERLNYLEGATNHATGTPLSKANKENAALRARCAALEQDRERPITAERWNDMLGQRDHLVAALRNIAGKWQAGAEACADSSTVAYEMAKTANDSLAAIDAARTSPGAGREGV